MNIRKRILPTRTILQRLATPGHPVDEEKAAGLELVIRLNAVSDLIREHFFSQLSVRNGISEGKLILLVRLYVQGVCSITELAERIGVSNATVSVMAKRMLDAPEPLIAMKRSSEDQRSRTVQLTDKGRRELESILPKHFAQVSQATAKLSRADQERLYELLGKMLESLDAAVPASG